MNVQMISKPLLRMAMGVCLFFMCSTMAHAQRIGLKTNALYWAAMSPNMGAEFRINRHVTLNFEAMGSLLKAGKVTRRGCSSARRRAIGLAPVRRQGILWA